MRSHLRNVRRNNRSTGPAPFWGTLQNPEAHKNAISNDEYQALIKRQLAEKEAAARAQAQREALARQREAEQLAEHEAEARDLRLARELDEARALAASAPPPITEPAGSPAEQSPLFTPTELEAANFAPVELVASADDPAQFVASADDATPRPHSRRPISLASNKRPGRKTLAEMSALERHARKCTVCRHPDRADIESDFLHWHDVSDITYEFKLGTRRALYRHARATGLYELRMSNIRDAAALIAARAENCNASASAVLKAIRACSLIDSNGVWHEPPTRTIRYTVLGEPQSAREAAPQPQPRPIEHTFLTPDELSTLTSSPTNAFNPTTKTALSNRHLVQLETRATSTKHSPDHISNRPKSPTFLNTLSRLFTPQNSSPSSELTHR